MCYVSLESLNFIEQKECERKRVSEFQYHWKSFSSVFREILGFPFQRALSLKMRKKLRNEKFTTLFTELKTFLKKPKKDFWIFAVFSMFQASVKAVEIIHKRFLKTAITYNFHPREFTLKMYSHENESSQIFHSFVCICFSGVNEFT
jgi:hypothetical protein